MIKDLTHLRSSAPLYIMKYYY